MADPVIVITVNQATGDITVNPTLCHVDSGQTITWLAVDASSLLITFENGAALGRPEVRGVRSKKIKLPGFGRVVGNATQRVRAANPPGIYHYQLSVVVDGTVYSDSACPTIVIR